MSEFYVNGKLDIHRRGDDSLPPPWYLPPLDVTTGPTRTRRSIIGGLLISNDEGREWYFRRTKRQLKPDHSQDITIVIQLRRLLKSQGIGSFGCALAARRDDSSVIDFLVITHIQTGPFTHNGPESYEEVLDEDMKPIPGVLDEEVKNSLEKLGVLVFESAPIPAHRDLAEIKTCGYKSYYTNIYP